MTAPEVHLDMTSLAGGEPRTLTPEAIAAGWEEGLRPIDHVHHQAGNFRVRLDADARGADASCHGVAYHHRRHPSGRNVRTFVGSYHFRPRRDGDAWRIASFRFDARFVDGNLELERDA